jgi:signal transduction histidine kinase
MPKGEPVSFDHQKRPPPRSPSPREEELDHDLRTPLAVIRVQTQLLLRGVDRYGNTDPERERFRAGLHRIDAAVSTMLTTIERISRESRRDEAGREGQAS